MGVYAYTYFTLPIDRPALPAVEAWYQRLKARPGFAQVTIPLT
jgi:glutathione S-transferase